MSGHGSKIEPSRESRPLLGLSEPRQKDPTSTVGAVHPQIRQTDVAADTSVGSECCHPF